MYCFTSVNLHESNYCSSHIWCRSIVSLRKPNNCILHIWCLSGVGLRTLNHSYSHMFFFQCSVSCGLGIIKRAPFCQRIKKNGRLERVLNSECDIKLKPDTEQICNLTECPQPLIKSKDVRLFQLNKMTKIKLVVGMRAHLLPETSVIVKCPHVGLDRQKVNWFKNGIKIRKLKRTRVTRSGTLRIRQARPDKDEGVYSCLIGGLESNVTLSFSSSFDVLQATLNREKYIKGVISPEDDVMNGTYLHMDPVDRRRKRLNLLSTDWTLCTVKCGGGLQSRNMSCEIITRNYYQVFPMSVCTNYLERKPLMIRSCKTEPCVRWRSGNWSQVGFKMILEERL